MSTRLTAICVLVVAAVCVWQAVEVFMLRFDTGDVYPAYSTFRSDPRGLRAIYDALSALPELNVERHLRDLHRIEGGAGTTLIIAGAVYGSDPVQVLDALDSFVIAGGRLVILFTPESEPAHGAADARRTAHESPGDEAPKRESQKMLDEKVEDIGERWGFTYGVFSNAGRRGERLERYSANLLVDEPALPNRLPWLAPVYFSPQAPEWVSLYGGCPPDNDCISPGTVLMERKRGAGAIVVSSDSYLLSNEAMRNDRYAALLRWIAGPSVRVLFDESHLNIQHREGIMTLARRYRLQGFLFLIGLLAALFVWYESYTLIPRRRQMEEDETLRLEHGRDASEGLETLIRRSIPLSELLEVCASEYRRSAPGAVVALQTSSASRQAGPALVAEYNRLADALHDAAVGRRGTRDFDTKGERT